MKKILSIILLAFALTACKNQTTQNTIKDREGFDITLKQDINKIISLAPSTTEILIDLGLKDNLVAVDKYSKKLLGDTNLPEFDIMNPDTESLASIQSDIIFATGMSRAKGDDPLKQIKDMGITVTYIPTSKSIAEIKQDIIFISEITNTQDKGNEIIKNMDNEIKKYEDIAKTITTKKTVYFEIGASPNMYSFGKDVFLNEIINIIGAKNIFEEQTSWITVTPESVVVANPDVILTNVDYVDNPVDEIKLRGGFADVNAVKNNDVFLVDKNSSSYSNHNVVKIMREISKLIYPKEYANQ